MKEPGTVFAGYGIRAPHTLRHSYYLTLTHTLSHTHTLFLSLSLIPPLPQTRTLSLFLSHILSHGLPLTLSLSHSHSHHRFDKVVDVQMPDVAGRKAILELYSKNVSTDQYHVMLCMRTKSIFMMKNQEEAFFLLYFSFYLFQQLSFRKSDRCIHYSLIFYFFSSSH